MLREPKAKGSWQDLGVWQELRPQRSCSHHWRYSCCLRCPKHSERRTILASPYLLISHTNLLKVPKVNLPTILSIRLEGIQKGIWEQTVLRPTKRQMWLPYLRGENIPHSNFKWISLSTVSSFHCPVRRASGSKYHNGPIIKLSGGGE